MILGARFLVGLSDINSWHRSQLIQDLTRGQTTDVYFQLVDLGVDVDLAPVSGRRYCPPATSTLQVVIDDINPALKVTRFATQVAATLDASVWKLSLLATDALPTGTRTLLLTLTEPGSVVKRGLVPQGLRIVGYDTSC